MNDNLDISNYLNEVHTDWQDSRDAFPNNTYPRDQWPIPFFGNPTKAVVATIGVNPSSGEFASNRNWAAVDCTKTWKLRLKDYFTDRATLPHKWFDTWRAGLKLLGVSYESGTAAHFDVSYRATKAMLRNQTTDRREFRHMVERDVAWLFRLLPLCPKLRRLLVYGPVVRHNGQTESLAGFVRKSAPRHGFKLIHREPFWELWHEDPRQMLVIHEADTPDEKCITCRVVKNLHAHRDELRERIDQGNRAL